MISRWTILGGPGAGKTEHLLTIVENFLKQGIHPEGISYVSYTKKAADEAKKRAIQHFKITKEDLPFFGTIHSICYQQLELDPKRVMDDKDYRIIKTHLGYPGNGSMIEGGPQVKLDGMVNYAEARGISLYEAWETSDGDINFWELERYVNTVNEYKADLGKVDFDDMLSLYLKECAPLPIYGAIIDEAQDLTRTQWKVIDHMMQRAQHIYLGGDDDQAIYRWSGADIPQFQERARQSKIKVLKQSHRLPESVFNLSLKVLKLIDDRLPKQLYPIEGREGSIEYLREPTEINLLDKQSWFLLARNKYYLKEFRRLCVEQGVSYLYENKSSVDEGHLKAIQGWENARAKKTVTPEQKDRVKQYKDKALTLGDDVKWHDALTGINLNQREYYVSIRHSGEKLLSPPRVTISTIHGVKGGEADNVLLLSDITYRSHEALWQHGDDEHRVFYVGVTRAKKNLFIVLPRSQYSYEALI